MSNHEPLKICRYCGLKAYTEDDLKKFRKQKQAKGGYLNLCNECRNKRERPEVHQRRQESKDLFEKGLKKCKKCEKRYNVLVNGICHNCNPEAWSSYFRKLYDVKGKN